MSLAGWARMLAEGPIEGAERSRHICQLCSQLLGVTGAGISMVTATGNRGVVCATDEVSARIEELQFTLGEGVCVEAVTSGAPVMVADLHGPGGAAAERWPAFMEGVAAAGVRAIFALPLRVGVVSVGALDLYRDVPGTLTADQLSAALTAADAAAAALLQLDIGSAGSFADSLVEDYDIVDLLDRLAAACVRLLGVTAAGLLLHDQQGHLAVVASSSEETRLLEIFQLQNDEGPCLECVPTGAAVVSGDLDADRVRWPLFASFALEAGFRSVAALPMRLREQTIGGLNLFGEGAGPVSPEDQRLAQALADVATIGILQQRSAQRSTVLAEHLQRALNSRVVIEQARGVLAERNGMSMEEAFDSLRLYSRDHNIKLTNLAVAVVHQNFNPAFRSGRPSAT